MKTKTARKEDKIKDFSNHSDRELAEAYIFPHTAATTAEKKKEEEEFWQQRRERFENRLPQEKMYAKLLQLKFELEDYVNSNQYKAMFNFGYFLNEYVQRQGKLDKQFATEIDIKPAVLSQYVNNHRKPPENFSIRLELHSNGLIPAVTWLRLLQKDKEHKIMTDLVVRKDESQHIKNKLTFAW
jgi:hypothetical protein